jgi:GT2 family glycosyltransferase
VNSDVSAHTKSSHNEMQPIWIVIVNYHSQDLVCRCIESLQKYIVLPFKVVVVDNSAKSETDKIEACFPDTKTIKATSNEGFAAGCNIGIEHAIEHQAEFILLLNPDTFTVQDFLSPMLEEFKNNDKLGMAGPTIFYEDPADKIWMAGSTKNWWSGGAKHILDDSLARDENPVLVPFMSGCCMLLRVKAIKDVGLMDTRYFLYFEDGDYCEAFLKNNWQISYIPKAKLVHSASSTTGFQSENYVYYFSRNRIWLLYRWAPKIAFVYYFLFTLLVKIPGSIVIFSLLKRKPKLTSSFIKGFIDGVKDMRT